MKDELKVRRQKRCAESYDGHDWSDPKTRSGTCKKCKLRVVLTKPTTRKSKIHLLLPGAEESVLCGKTKPTNVTRDYTLVDCKTCYNMHANNLARNRRIARR